MGNDHQDNRLVNWNCKPISNFSLGEMKCQCGCGLVIFNWTLVIKLLAARDKFGNPIIVNSWSRCREHNKLVGGKRNSYHLYGKAVDIKPPNAFFRPGMSGDFIDLCMEFFPYVKVYDTFCHCDTRGPRRVS